MNYQKNYVKKLNFKDYEKSNSLTYELIMRNKECQNSFKKLHKIILKLMDEAKIYERSMTEFSNNQTLHLYVSERWGIDENIDRVNNLKYNFLKQLMNYFLILKGTKESYEWAQYFQKYISQKEELLFNDQHINYRTFIESIHNMMQNLINEIYKTKSDIDEDIVKSVVKDIYEGFVNFIGYKMMSLKYEAVAEIKTTSEIKQALFWILEKYFEKELKKIDNQCIEDLSMLNRKKKNYINDEMEPYYNRYRKNRRNIERLEKLRHKTESYISYEFYIDFQKELYLKYSFFSEKLQEDLKIFYLNLVEKQYDELEIKTMSSINKEEIIEDKEYKIGLRKYLSLDNKLMDELESIYLEEDLLKMIKSNPNESIFSSTSVYLIYSRPSLFSERFRNITMTFNPNISKKN